MHIDLVSRDGHIESGEFILWDEDPDNPDQVRLDLRFAGERIIASADTFFDALAEMRRTLERQGFRPKCLGATKNFYPSPMIRSMGGGEKAYRLRLGCPAKTEDLVSIFDSDRNTDPVSVEEQEEFYRIWLKSLK